MRNIINVISGKGGTGKTLLTAVLAKMLGDIGKEVLVIDMDIFVRGLTALLYYQKGEAIKIISDDKQWSVSDFFRNNKNNNGKDMDNLGDEVRLATCRYQTFEVVPSVRSVDTLLPFSILPASFQEASAVLSAIIKKIPDKYDYIFLDSRAGYDSLIAATHKVSKISLCVEEDDNISMVTSENLIAQLKEDSSRANDSSATILQIKNKTRDTQLPSSKMSVNFLGAIPFDADIMKNFGTSHFWMDIDNSLYKEALIKVWNSLSKKMELYAELPEGERTSPIGSQKVEQRLSMLPTSGRMLFICGIVLLFIGVILYYNQYFFSGLPSLDTPQLIGLIGVTLGFLTILVSVFTSGKK